MSYTLKQNGDSFEQKSWTLFLSSGFPSYERYWEANITPLTKRPANIHFKSSKDLQAVGFNGEDVCRLNFTTLF
jgi:hypothetical protein